MPETPTRGLDSHRVLFVGHVTHAKGVPELLEAVRHLALSATLVVAGDDVEGLLTDSGGDRHSVTRIEYVGWVDDPRLRELYESSAVFVLPSHVEGLPLALLEAMSYGLACVATPVGGIPEVLREQATGIVVPVRDPSALQAGLEAGVPLGYSCAMGGCGACKVKLLSGSVHMDEPNALTAQEREQGYVLACIAHPTEPVEVESK